METGLQPSLTKRYWTVSIEQHEQYWTVFFEQYDKYWTVSFEPYEDIDCVEISSCILVQLLQF